MIEGLLAVLFVLLGVATTVDDAGDPTPPTPPAPTLPTPTPPAPTLPTPTPPEPESEPETEPEPTPFQPLEKFKSVEDQAAAYPESEKRLSEIQNEVGVLRDLVRQAVGGGFLARGGPAPAAEVTPEQEQETRIKPLVDQLVAQDWEPEAAAAHAKVVDAYVQSQLLPVIDAFRGELQREVGPSAIEREATPYLDTLIKATPALAQVDAKQVLAEVVRRTNVEDWRGVPEETRKAFIEDLAYRELGRQTATGGVKKVPGGPTAPAVSAEPVGGSRAGRGGGGKNAEIAAMAARIMETSEGRLTQEQADAIAMGKPLP